MTTYINHFIGGTATEGNSSRTAPVFNPATGVVEKEVRLGSVADVDSAVQAAAAAGAQLRTYRLAMGSNGEYTQLVGGTAAAMGGGGMVPTIRRWSKTNRPVYRARSGG